jgi:endoglucanase
MRKESLDFLKKLLVTPSPSGFEGPNQKIWCNYARKIADEVRTDAYGNAVAVLNPKGSPKIMLDGHVDEIGMMIKHIDEKGYLYFQRIGGVDPALISAKRVNIHTADGVVRGVIGATAIHLQDKKEDRKSPKMHELFIDIGAADGEAARKRVNVGDPITFVDDFEMLDDNIGVSRAFDNRVGVWAIIEAMRIAKAKNPKAAIFACSNVQEEVGLKGAIMSVYNVKPDLAVVVDVTHATDTPGINVKQHGEVKLGQGPTVSIGREHHPKLVERLRKVAKRGKIDLQIEAFSTTGGTNAYAIYTANGGVPSALLSIPTRYMHSTVEMLDIRDLQHTAEVLGAFCADVKKGELFKADV